jgi:RimJ/RimL family protein N-acetyltransferase
VTEIVAETERLRLRTWKEGDRAEFVRQLNTPAVMRWLGGVQDEATYTAAFDRIDGFQRDFGHTFWIVERKSDGAFLGFCGLKRVNSPGASCPGDFEVGWRFREDSWRQGYAKEAAIAALDLAFGRYHAPHVVALTVPGNVSSQGLMTRLGMRRTPELDFEDERFGPDLNPWIVYRIDAGDWPLARAAATS